MKTSGNGRRGSRRTSTRPATPGRSRKAVARQSVRLGFRARSATLRARSLLAIVLRKSSHRAVLICRSCELTGGPFGVEEAAMLLRVHEQLHHGGANWQRSPLPPAA